MNFFPKRSASQLPAETGLYRLTRITMHGKENLLALWVRDEARLMPKVTRRRPGQGIAECADRRVEKALERAEELRPALVEEEHQVGEPARQSAYRA